MTRDPRCYVLAMLRLRLLWERAGRPRPLDMSEWLAADAEAAALNLWLIYYQEET